MLPNPLCDRERVYGWSGGASCHPLNKCLLVPRSLNQILDVACLLYLWKSSGTSSRKLSRQSRVKEMLLVFRTRSRPESPFPSASINNHKPWKAVYPSNGPRFVLEAVVRPCRGPPSHPVLLWDLRIRQRSTAITTLSTPITTFHTSPAAMLRTRSRAQGTRVEFTGIFQNHPAE